MMNTRAAGILLHPTSLPGKYGIGDLGENAYKFVDFLKKSGQSLWQVFPLGPTGYGDSPYQCFSAFAGNPLLISPDLLKSKGLLSDDELDNVPFFDPTNIDFGEVIKFKTGLLQKAYANFKNNGSELGESSAQFFADNKNWLNDYSLFMAAKSFHGGVQWTEWSEDIALRKPGAVEEWTKKLEDEINYQKFLQFLFNEQWQNLKKYASENDVKIIGDLPIFIAYDSSDCWASKDLFSVDEKGKLKTVAGVPPDYFSETGQLWGNPLYRWDAMEKNDFKWWRRRFENLFKMVDIVRIDHFRGFDAFWEIPGDAETAINGKWIKAPGKKLFNSVKKHLGKLPIIAEDLGVITKSVAELRDEFEFPGIKIMQFAFGEGGDKKFLPHNHIKNCIVHTGSHDNDTTKGFFDKAKVNDPEIYNWTQNYLNYYGDDICDAMIKTVYASVANTVVIPMQDVLNLGGEARMNFPGKLGGNWGWRFTWDQISEDLEKRYLYLVDVYERNGIKKDEYEQIEVEEENKEK
jgi:4-alpha-glucanotransferase